MDLAGHERFSRESPGRIADARLGEALLSAGWAALASARAETLDIRLRSGAAIAGVVALRIDGSMAEASTFRGHWTHFFPVADVVLVHVIVRGGKRAH